jgi:hypothetical protein
MSVIGLLINPHLLKGLYSCYSFANKYLNGFYEVFLQVEGEAFALVVNLST